MNRNQAKIWVRHTPESQIRHPFQLFRRMGLDLLASRDLAWRLLVRDLSAMYRQSILGFLWAFLPPIVAAGGLTLASNAKVLNVGTTEIPYAAFVMFSMSLWQTFVEALNGPIIAVQNAKQMLAKINFPRESLILSKLGEVLVNFAIKLILIISLFIWFRVPVTWSVFLAPVALIHLILLGTAIGIFLAPLGALYQDFSKGVVLITGLWLFLTPVVFPTPQGKGLFSTLVNLNPVTPLLVTTRDLATTGTISNPEGFWLVSGLTLVGLLIAWLFYHLAMPFVVERMSS